MKKSVITLFPTFNYNEIPVKDFNFDNFVKHCDGEFNKVDLKKEILDSQLNFSKAMVAKDQILQMI